MMKQLFYTLSLSLVVLISACDNNDLMLSEKKLNGEIQKNWKIMTPSPARDYRETWSFSNGGVDISFKKDTTFHVTPTTTKDSTMTVNIHGSYSIDAKFSKSYVKMSGFNFANLTNSGYDFSDLNRTWTIVELQSGVMYLSTTNDKGIIISVEFIEW